MEVCGRGLHPRRGWCRSCSCCGGGGGCGGGCGGGGDDDIPTRRLRTGHEAQPGGERVERVRPLHTAGLCHAGAGGKFDDSNYDNDSLLVISSARYKERSSNWKSRNSVNVSKPPTRYYSDLLAVFTSNESWDGDGSSQEDQTDHPPDESFEVFLSGLGEDQVQLLSPERETLKKNNI